jgi:hypothetical protein
MIPTARNAVPKSADIPAATMFMFLPGLYRVICAPEKQVRG